MATLVKNDQRITVPDAVAAGYIKEGWRDVSVPVAPPKPRRQRPSRAKKPAASVKEAEPSGE